MLDAFDEGKLKAKTEGKIEEKLKIAKSHKNIRVTIDVIIKSTGLSKEEIEQL